MKKIVLVLALSCLTLGLIKGSFNDLEASIRSADLTRTETWLKNAHLHKTEKDRLLKLNTRIIKYYQKKLYAAKSLFKLSRRQVILAIKSGVCGIFSVGIIAGTVAHIMRVQPNPYHVIPIISSAGLGIGSLIYLVNVFAYPDKLQKRFNQSLEIEQILLKH